MKIKFPVIHHDKNIKPDRYDSFVVEGFNECSTCAVTSCMEHILENDINDTNDAFSIWLRCPNCDQTSKFNFSGTNCFNYSNERTVHDFNWKTYKTTEANISPYATCESCKSNVCLIPKTIWPNGSHDADNAVDIIEKPGCDGRSYTQDEYEEYIKNRESDGK